MQVTYVQSCTVTMSTLIYPMAKLQALLAESSYTLGLLPPSVPNYCKWRSWRLTVWLLLGEGQLPWMGDSLCSTIQVSAVYMDLDVAHLWCGFVGCVHLCWSKDNNQHCHWILNATTYCKHLTLHYVRGILALLQIMCSSCYISYTYTQQMVKRLTLGIAGDWKHLAIHYICIMRNNTTSLVPRPAHPSYKCWKTGYLQYCGHFVWSWMYLHTFMNHQNLKNAEPPVFRIEWTGYPVPTVSKLYKIHSIIQTLVPAFIKLCAKFGGFKGQALY